MCRWLTVGGRDGFFLPAHPARLADSTASPWDGLNSLLPNVNTQWHFDNTRSDNSDFFGPHPAHRKTVTEIWDFVSFQTVIMTIFFFRRHRSVVQNSYIFNQELHFELNSHTRLTLNFNWNACRGFGHTKNKWCISFKTLDTSATQTWPVIGMETYSLELQVKE